MVYGIDNQCGAGCGTQLCRPVQAQKLSDSTYYLTNHGVGGQTRGVPRAPQDSQRPEGTWHILTQLWSVEQVDAQSLPGAVSSGRAPATHATTRPRNRFDGGIRRGTSHMDMWLGSRPHAILLVTGSSYYNTPLVVRTLACTPYWSDVL
jgi:hypothetical protein